MGVGVFLVSYSANVCDAVTAQGTPKEAARVIETTLAQLDNSDTDQSWPKPTFSGHESGAR